MDKDDGVSRLTREREKEKSPSDVRRTVGGSLSLSNEEERAALVIYLDETEKTRKEDQCAQYTIHRHWNLRRACDSPRLTLQRREDLDGFVRSFFSSSLLIK